MRLLRRSKQRHNGDLIPSSYCRITELGECEIPSEGLRYLILRRDFSSGLRHKVERRETRLLSGPLVKPVPPSSIVLDPPGADGSRGDLVIPGTFFNKSGIDSGIPHAFLRMSKEGRWKRRKLETSLAEKKSRSREGRQCAQPHPFFISKRFLTRGGRPVPTPCHCIFPSFFDQSVTPSLIPQEALGISLEGMTEGRAAGVMTRHHDGVIEAFQGGRGGIRPNSRSQPEER